MLLRHKKAKKYNIIVVPSDNFGVKGYVRLAYCISSKTMFFIDNSHDINIKLSDLFNFSFETDIIEDKPHL